MIALAASRSSWYWASVSVSAGATVTLSPVCTPMGSMFSMEQMTTTLSARSRMTSSSNSCQPTTDSSSRTCVMGLRRSPCSADAPEALAVVGDAAAGAAEGEGRAHDERQAELVGGGLGLLHGLGEHAARHAQADLLHGRAELEAVLGAPDGVGVGADHLDLPEVEHAALLSSMARFSAVWPPSVGSRASGRSISMMRVSVARSSGSM